MMNIVRKGFWGTVMAFAFPAAIAWGGTLVPLSAAPTMPAQNLGTKSKVELGKHLFFDPRLSKNGSISCAFCHVPTAGYADPRPVSIGVDNRRGGRNSPTVLNAAYFPKLFWDGRASSLEEQAIGPLGNPVEMANPDYNALVGRLRKIRYYRVAFYKVYGGAVSLDRIAQSLSAFERTLVTPDSPYDRYLMGDVNALNDAQKRGLAIFKGKGRCAVCHNGPLLSDLSYHNLGVPQVGPLAVDVGRYAVTHNPEDKGRFRTAGLRNIALTAPYMHDGVFRTLRDVVDFYDKGGGSSPYPKDPLIVPLHLTDQEKSDLISFLKSLNGETKTQESYRASRSR